jgi:hypothetical protein
MICYYFYIELKYKCLFEEIHFKWVTTNKLIYFNYKKAKLQKTLKYKS